MCKIIVRKNQLRSNLIFLINLIEKSYVGGKSEEKNEQGQFLANLFLDFDWFWFGDFNFNFLFSHLSGN